jgi:hypothetical protein
MAEIRTLRTAKSGVLWMAKIMMLRMTKPGGWQSARDEILRCGSG